MAQLLDVAGQGVDSMKADRRGKQAEALLQLGAPHGAQAQVGPAAPEVPVAQLLDAAGQGVDSMKQLQHLQKRQAKAHHALLQARAENARIRAASAELRGEAQDLESE